MSSNVHHCHNITHIFLTYIVLDHIGSGHITFSCCFFFFFQTEDVVSLVMAFGSTKEASRIATLVRLRVLGSGGFKMKGGSERQAPS